MNSADQLPNLSAEITVEFGRIRMTINDLLSLKEGSLIPTDAKHRKRSEGGPMTDLDVRLNGEPFAVGEVVTIDESYGVRISKMAD